MVVSWTLGLVLGVAAGASVVLGVPGLMIGALLVVATLWARPRGVMTAGALVGIGSAWLLLWSRALQACGGANTASAGCEGPDLAGLQVIPLALLAVGGLVSTFTALRR